MNIPAAGKMPAHLKATMWMPDEPSTVEHVCDIIAEVGIALQAAWGIANPLLTAGEIAHQVVLDQPLPDRPPAGLPSLAMPQQIDGLNVPHMLGWVNYWSESTAKRIRFSGPLRDDDLLKRARQVEGGGWVVRLTDPPLDLNLDSHRTILRRAYEVLPAVGGRNP
jgi:hypothetical protein